MVSCQAEHGATGRQRRREHRLQCGSSRGGREYHKGKAVHSLAFHAFAVFAFAWRCPFEVCRRMISELRFLNLHWEFSGSL